MAMLPSDAYAIVLLVDHDIYETPDDDFCAGRAYGGSRVSVVQTARYNPLLDEKIGIARGQAWPMSHCKCVVKEICDAEGDIEIKPPSAAEIRLSKSGAMRSAIDAVVPLKTEETKEELEALWSSRVLRTVSHELGYVYELFYCPCDVVQTLSIRIDIAYASHTVDTMPV
jgi:archaemetzincin